MELRAALLRAEAAGLDLVEVSPNATPPVCRIMDFGKLKYDQKKREHESKKKQQAIRVKEVKFRLQIGANDFETKVQMARRFLEQGCKVRLTVMFRGRQVQRQDLGESLISRLLSSVADRGVVDKRTGLEGNRITIMVTPRSGKGT